MGRKDQKGLTLIEVINSIAVLSIISIVFITSFSTGFIGILKAGDKAIAAYESQKEITNKMVLSGELGEYEKDKIEIIFKNDSTAKFKLEIEIGIIESEVNIRGSKSIIKSFFLKP